MAASAASILIVRKFQQALRLIEAGKMEHPGDIFCLMMTARALVSRHEISWDELGVSEMQLQKLLSDAHKAKINKDLKEMVTKDEPSSSDLELIEAVLCELKNGHLCPSDIELPLGILEGILETNPHIHRRSMAE